MKQLATYTLYQDILKTCRKVARLYERVDRKAYPLFERVVRDVMKLSKSPDFEAVTGYADVHELLRDGEIYPVLLRMKVSSYSNRRKLIRLAGIDDALAEINILRRERLPSVRVIRQVEQIVLSDAPRAEKVEQALAVLEEPLTVEAYVSSENVVVTEEGVVLRGGKPWLRVRARGILFYHLLARLVPVRGRWNLDGPTVAFYDSANRKEVVADILDEDLEGLEFLERRLKHRERREARREMAIG